MKKKLTLLVTLGLSLLFSTSVFAATPTFSDIDGQNCYAKNEILQLANDQIINGYEDGTFQPSKDINRQEFAIILAKSLKLQPDAEAAAKFTDVADWARPYVGALLKAGVTKGYGDTTFGALDSLNRQDLAVFFVRAMKLEDTANTLYQENFFKDSFTFTDAGEISDYAKGDVALAQAIGFINGWDNAFHPKDKSQRQAVARLAYEYIYHCDSVYIPNFIRLLMPEATSVTNNGDGTFTTALKQVIGVNKTSITFTYEEVSFGVPFAYQNYRIILKDNNFLNYWQANGGQLKPAIVGVILSTWSLKDIGVTLDPATYASDAAIKNTINTLLSAINDYKMKNPFKKLNEDGLIQIGKNCGILQ